MLVGSVLMLNNYGTNVSAIQLPITNNTNAAVDKATGDAPPVRGRRRSAEQSGYGIPVQSNAKAFETSFSFDRGLSQAHPAWPSCTIPSNILTLIFTHERKVFVLPFIFGCVAPSICAASRSCGQ